MILIIIDFNKILQIKKEKKSENIEHIFFFVVNFYVQELR